MIGVGWFVVSSGIADTFGAVVVVLRNLSIRLSPGIYLIELLESGIV